jgi:hypothetical protein
MIDLNKLAQVSNEIACEKGWWDGSPRSTSALTLLMQSENAEALEDYRANKALTEVWYEVKYEPDPGTGLAGPIKVNMTQDEIDKMLHLAKEKDLKITILEKKPCGIPVELADTIIRVADFAAFRSLDLNVEYEKLPAGRSAQDFEEALAESNYWISLIWWAHKQRDEGGLAFKLVKSVDCILLMCEYKGIAIEKAIEIKTAFNRTRPVRHGGKKI